VDIIKLDISFIRNVTKDTKAGEIVLAMINLAHALNLLVVAEGVEKTDQLKFFRKSKCDAVQGFLLGTPLPAEAMTKWMQRQLYKYAGR
jgi:EAL domain-containing protein (putative c-di-GMP-specific phosphodiesterase class I)